MDAFTQGTTTNTPGKIESTRRGYKRLASHLQLPLTPRFDDETEFDDDMNESCQTVPSACTDNADCWTADLERSIWEDWDEEIAPGLEVTFDEDGAQVIHIPAENPFYDPATPPRSFSYQPFSEGRPRRSNAPVTHFPDSIFAESPVAEVRISSKRENKPAPASKMPQRPVSTNLPAQDHSHESILVLDTKFLSNLGSTVNLSSWTASWCSPAMVRSEKALPWVRREADVPCSAIAFSPTDPFYEASFNMLRSAAV
ncbi:hypothetical protein FA15DRAFT_333873 [Coprinopsis marcescibilis]|uniref:Uncharacterized protein n=1 Tax=Coprinopsis marcescibilis TaxID=230819 RepID=A0A5C3KZE3_COPMA|nr:hypothetical protein FA15DRAFT_333873 [Coprinopsis marcescibilis]